MVCCFQMRTLNNEEAPSFCSLYYSYYYQLWNLSPLCFFEVVWLWLALLPATLSKRLWRGLWGWWRWQPRKHLASSKPSCNLKLNLEGEALFSAHCAQMNGLWSDQKGFLVNTTLHWQSLSFHVHFCPSVGACMFRELDLVWAVESLVSVGTTLASAALSCWWVVPWPGTSWKWMILSGQAKTEAYLRQNRGRSHPSSFGGLLRSLTSVLT